MLINRRNLYRLLFITAAIVCLILAVYFNYSLSRTAQAITEPGVRLPIVMYHHFLKDSNSWGKYVISPDDFEMDLVYLQKEGYTTIVVQDLIDYAYNDKELPKKPIMLTFDDGFLATKTYILPILEKYNAKAVISIVGEFTDRFTQTKDDRLSYAHLNWEDIRELVNCPNIEIQNHSYDMHKLGRRKGVAKLKSESEEEYKKILYDDIMHMQELTKKNTGYTPAAFTYPFGEASKCTGQIIKDMGFLATLTCNEGVNILSGDKEELYDLKRYNRPNNINREKFFSKFE